MILSSVSDSDLLAECQRRISKRGALYLKDQRVEVGGLIMTRGSYSLYFHGFHPLVDDPDFPPAP